MTAPASDWVAGTHRLMISHVTTRKNPYIRFFSVPGFSVPFQVIMASCIYFLPQKYFIKPYFISSTIPSFILNYISLFSVYFIAKIYLEMGFKTNNKLITEKCFIKKGSRLPTGQVQHKAQPAAIPQPT
jgi:hypothetical protein